MSSPTGKCALCGETNPQTVVHCVRCGYRLPWADQVEDVITLRGRLKENAMDRELTELGLLSAETVRCRFCNGRIEVNARQCPHCKEWLSAGAGLGAAAPFDVSRHD